MRRSRNLFSSKRQFQMRDVWYDLPKKQIGVRPAERGESRLLHFGGGIEHRRFRDIVSLVPQDCVMVFNSSKVMHARLWAGSVSDPIEIMMLSPLSPSNDPSLCYREKVRGQIWNVVIRGKPIKSVDIGDVFRCGSLHVKITRLVSVWEEHGELPGYEVSVELMMMTEDKREVTLASALNEVGDVPIPPYLNRSTIAEDKSNYQTVYADSRHTGSVAAPTAGLHFSEQILTDLRLKKGVTICDSLSLHVGAGTFKPVVSDCISEHDMHSESFSASRKDLSTIAAASKAGSSNIICVGTTSVRLVESLYWCGVRGMVAASTQEEEGASSRGRLELGQWEVYDIERSWGKRYPKRELPSLAESYEYLLATHLAGGKETLSGATSLCITPGYKFRATGKLITNFHQAESTLMLLVSAFLGDRCGSEKDGGVSTLRHLYKSAVKKGYKFLSYGDSMFIDL